MGIITCSREHLINDCGTYYYHWQTNRGWFDKMSERGWGIALNFVVYDVDFAVISLQRGWKDVRFLMDRTIGIEIYFNVKQVINQRQNDKFFYRQVDQ